MLTKILQKFCPDSWFTKFWSNPRFRGIIKLLLWFIVIALLYFIYISPYDEVNYITENTTNVEDNINDNVSYETLKNNLLENNFVYYYTFEEGENGITYYKGTSLGNEKLIYVQKDGELKEYYLKDNETYIVNMGEISLTDQLILNEYFNMDYIFSLVSDIEPDETESEFIFKNDNIYVKMIISDANFSKIELVTNGNSYIYEFKNVGKVEEIIY